MIENRTDRLQRLKELVPKTPQILVRNERLLIQKAIDEMWEKLGEVPPTPAEIQEYDEESRRIDAETKEFLASWEGCMECFEDPCMCEEWAQMEKLERLEDHNGPLH